MGFKAFRVQVAVRLALLAALVFVAAWSLPNTDWWATPLVCGVLAVLLLIELIRYVESVNRELVGFLEFVEQRDFSPAFPIGEKGNVFRDLEAAYRVLVGRYRSLNLEKAANHRYLESLIEHVSVALLCLDETGEVLLMNRQAKTLFKTPQLLSVRSLARADAGLPRRIAELGDGGRALLSVEIGGEPLQLALYATEFELLDRRYKLISFQDIRDELEQREVDYSQRLIKTLTHEIMNSVTPIISLTTLIEERLVDAETGELSTAKLGAEEQHDLRRSLASIQSRGRGLLRFVQAYGSLTNLPQPQIVDAPVKALLERVETLLAPALKGVGIELEVRAAPELRVRADPQQLEQVLINLVKNAAEALTGRADGKIVLRAVLDERGKALIQVSDNGVGIEPAAIDNIFVPFFTTKRSGSGIGLSVSRQIMLLNKGLITVKSVPGQGCEFTLRFK